MHFHLPKPLHGWREFLGEVGIIVIGVLIALSAEQTIEWLHWRHEARLAREALAFDFRRIIGEAAQTDAFAPCLAGTSPRVQSRAGRGRDDEAAGSCRLRRYTLIPAVELAQLVRADLGTGSRPHVQSRSACRVRPHRCLGLGALGSGPTKQRLGGPHHHHRARSAGLRDGDCQHKGYAGARRKGNVR